MTSDWQSCPAEAYWDLWDYTVTIDAAGGYTSDWGTNPSFPGGVLVLEIAFDGDQINAYGHAVTACLDANNRPEEWWGYQVDGFGDPWTTEYGTNGTSTDTCYVSIDMSLDPDW